MCNLSQGIWEQGIKQSVEQGELNEPLAVIERMMETFGYTFDEACHIAGYKGKRKIGLLQGSKTKVNRWLRTFRKYSQKEVSHLSQLDGSRVILRSITDDTKHGNTASKKRHLISIHELAKLYESTSLIETDSLRNRIQTNMGSANMFLGYILDDILHV